MRFTKVFVLATVVALLPASLAWAQGIVTGSISGTVQDAQGAVINGATVTAVQQGTNIKSVATTTGNGTFILRALPVGLYSVSVTSSGFAVLKLNSVEVNSGKDTSLGLRQLAVSGAEEVVNVESSMPLIESTTSQVASSFSSQQLTDLPIGNTFDNIALLAPGVIMTHDNTFSNRNGSGISSNGQRGRSNNFEIDGQNNNDNSVGGPALFFGNQDALQEVQVVTNNFSAEYGRNTGSVVNYVTKSGTNDFHGTAYEFYTGSFLSSLANDQKSPTFGFCLQNQNPTTDNCTEAVVPRVVDNRYGGTIGGPVIKNKLWFFGSTNYEQQNNGVTPAASTGAFTPTPTGLQQLAAAFPGNAAVAALTSFGPFAIKAGNPSVVPGTTRTLIVQPGATPVPIEFGQVQRLVPAEFRDKEITGRVDWQFRDKDHVFGRYLYQSQLFTGSLANSNTVISRGSYNDVPSRNQQVGIDWTRNWSATFVNQFRVSYFRENVAFEGGAVPNCVRATLNDCPSSVSVGATNGTSIFGWGYSTAIPQGRIVNNTQFQDNATFQKGKHLLKFGGEYDRQRSPNVFLPNANGSYSFANFNNFLNGIGTLTLADGPTSLNFKEQDAAAYFQDDWKVFPTLTINVGLRWEFFQQAINSLHDLTTARESGSGAFWNPTLPLSAKTVAAIPENYKYFQPNIGFAYAPHLFGSRSTVVRGGYRVNFDPAFYNMFLNVGTSAPVVNAGSIACTASAPCLPGNGIMGSDVRSLNLARIPRGQDPRARNETLVANPFKNPYAQNYTFGMQQELTPKIVGELRYAGNYTLHNFQTLDANPRIGGATGLATNYPNVIPANVTVCSTPGAPGLNRIDCTHSNVRERANTAFSKYNALQSRLDFRDFRGVSAGVSYTWSHTIDNASEIFSTGAAGNTVAVAPNPFDVTRSETANSGLDLPNVTSVYVNYRLPFFASGQGFKAKMLGGWEINNIYLFNSGQPASAAQLAFNGSACDASFASAFLGSFDECRPYFLGGNIYDPTRYAINSGKASTDFNGNPVAQAATNPFGVQRNTLRTQSYNNLDTSVYKNTKITERFTLQLQATALNILNRQFRGLGGTAIDPFIEDLITKSDGSIDPVLNTFLNNHGNASNNRTVTLGAKVIF
ncbi:MAG TPA: carboxypeptidase regulatory-like domain-containing protein [Terriglobales bacterium]|nr:carboxypeptidase regulatory-like domain-containing protein [Terriglobales bacterium]